MCARAIRVRVAGPRLWGYFSCRDAPHPRPGTLRRTCRLQDPSTQDVRWWRRAALLFISAGQRRPDRTREGPLPSHSGRFFHVSDPSPGSEGRPRLTNRRTEFIPLLPQAGTLENGIPSRFPSRAMPSVRAATARRNGRDPVRRDRAGNGMNSVLRSRAGRAGSARSWELARGGGMAPRLPEKPTPVSPLPSRTFRIASQAGPRRDLQSRPRHATGAGSRPRLVAGRAGVMTTFVPLRCNRLAE